MENKETQKLFMKAVQSAQTIGDIIKAVETYMEDSNDLMKAIKTAFKAGLQKELESKSISGAAQELESYYNIEVSGAGKIAMVGVASQIKKFCKPDVELC